LNGSYFQLNSEPVSQKITNELDENRNKYNELFNKYITLKNQIDDYSKYVEEETRKDIFEEKTSHLPYTQKEKLNRLMESTDFKSNDEFESGLDVLIEEFIQPKNDYNTINESRSEKRNRYLDLDNGTGKYLNTLI